MAQIHQNGDHFVIYGYRRYLNPLRLHKKRALLSYLPKPIIDNMAGKKTVRFSNSGIVLSWARVLNELGYVVDVVDWEDKTFRPGSAYDLVVFHGAKNFQNIYPVLAGSPRIIHFLSGSYWKFNNKAEDRRIADFEKRHGVKMPRDRYIFANEDPVNEAADGLVVLGDPSMRDTYPSKYPKVITINNASYPDKHHRHIERDYRQARKHFLFFAGSGNIHKGLDLLIDCFKDTEDLHLWIVTVLEQKFLDVYVKELVLPNIHLIGQVEMRDKQFYDAMDRCAYAILPSCSEGQAGSVVEAMNQGLIPIVSKETRLDAHKYGVVLANTRIPTIRKMILEMSRLSPSTIYRMASRMRQIVEKHHTPKSFRKELRKAIIEILSEKQQV